MHNIKDIRSDIDKFIESISKRNIKLDKNEITELDIKNRTLIQEKEKLEKKRHCIHRSKSKERRKN